MCWYNLYCSMSQVQVKTIFLFDCLFGLLDFHVSHSAVSKRCTRGTRTARFNPLLLIARVISCIDSQLLSKEKMFLCIHQFSSQIPTSIDYTQLRQRFHFNHTLWKLMWSMKMFQAALVLNSKKPKPNSESVTGVILLNFSMTSPYC